MRSTQQYAGVVPQSLPSPRGHRGAVISLLLGMVAGMLCLVAIYAKAIEGSGDATDRATAEALQDLTVRFGEYTATERYGIKDGSLTVVVTNTSAERQTFDFKVEALHADGTRITTDTAYVADLAPGQSDEISMFDVASQKDVPLLGTAAFRVIEASAY